MPTLQTRRLHDIVEEGFRYFSLPAEAIAGDQAVEIWCMQARACRTAVEGHLPAACAEIVFNLGPTGRHLVSARETRPSTSHRAAWVTGPHTDLMLIAKEIVDCEVVGIRLRPDAIPAVLGVPAAELSGRMIDLDAFWGSDVERIRECLYASPAPASRAAIVEAEILRRTHATLSPDQAAIRAIRASIDGIRGSSVGRIADRFGLSHRRVIELFDHHVGLKPKRYQQVQRVRAVMRAVVERRRCSLAALAFELGYTDQAHLANEFRRLTGLTVSGYLSHRSPVGLGSIRHHLAPEA